MRTEFVVVDGDDWQWLCILRMMTVFFILIVSPQRPEICDASVSGVPAWCGSQLLRHQQTRSMSVILALFCLTSQAGEVEDPVI